MPELFRGSQSTLGTHRVGILLPFGHRFTAHLACGIYRVLRLNGRDDFRNGDRQFGQLVGFDPEPHRILAGAEDLYASNSIQTGELVRKIDVGVVGQELGIVGAIRRIKGQEHQWSGNCFLHSDTEICDVDGKLRGGLRFAHLSKNKVCVRFRLHIVVDDQSHLPVGRGVQRVHVVHIVHAAHLLLDRRCDGLLDGLRVSAHVRRDYLNLWRNNVRKLGNRQARDRDRADDHHQNRNDHGHDGTIDKKFGHSSVAFRPRSALLDPYGGTVSHLLQTFDDHELSGADAAFDNPHRTYTLANFYGQEGHLVAFHHGYLIGSLELGNSPLRHQQSAYSGFARRAHASELAGAQDIVGIGKSAYQLNAAGRDIHLPIR